MNAIAPEKGMFVTYWPHHQAPENGTVTSWNKHYVFVQFKDGGPKACKAQDLINLDGNRLSLLDKDPA